MADENALEAVGQAEDVIQRLVNERRSLENAQQVLRTYRMVKSEMAPSLLELKGIKESIVAERRALDAIRAQKVNALERAREEVDRFRTEQLEQVNNEIEKKQGELAGLEERYKGTLEASERKMSEYERDLKDVSAELEKTQKVLESTKREHKVLAEAITKAAGFFAKESV